jgi:alkylation response protein AidB-like acyl-CoA dehydrogenase
LVLARLPDAPAGPKGLSLFLVPKFYADGTRSAVHCERIEEGAGHSLAAETIVLVEDLPRKFERICSALNERCGAIPSVT